LKEWGGGCGEARGDAGDAFDEFIEAGRLVRNAAGMAGRRKDFMAALS
jgi:hypothetical protein